MTLCPVEQKTEIPPYTRWFNTICPSCGRYGYHEVRDDSEDVQVEHARCDKCFVVTLRVKQEYSEEVIERKKIAYKKKKQEKQTQEFQYYDYLNKEFEQIEESISFFLDYARYDSNGKMYFHINRLSGSLF